MRKLRMLGYHLDPTRRENPDEQVRAYILLNEIEQKRDQMLSSDTGCRDALKISARSSATSPVKSPTSELKDLELENDLEKAKIRQLEEENATYEQQFNALAADNQALRAERLELKKLVEKLLEERKATEQ